MPSRGRRVVADSSAVETSARRIVTAVSRRGSNAAAVAARSAGDFGRRVRPDRPTRVMSRTSRASSHAHAAMPIPDVPPWMVQRSTPSPGTTTRPRDRRAATRRAATLADFDSRIAARSASAASKSKTSSAGGRRVSRRIAEDPRAPPIARVSSHAYVFSSSGASTPSAVASRASPASRRTRGSAASRHAHRSNAHAASSPFPPRTVARISDASFALVAPRELPSLDANCATLVAAAVVLAASLGARGNETNDRFAPTGRGLEANRREGVASVEDAYVGDDSFDSAIVTDAFEEVAARVTRMRLATHPTTSRTRSDPAKSAKDATRETPRSSSAAAAARARDRIRGAFAEAPTRRRYAANCAGTNGSRESFAKVRTCADWNAESSAPGSIALPRENPDAASARMPAPSRPAATRRAATTTRAFARTSTTVRVAFTAKARTPHIA